MYHSSRDCVGRYCRGGLLAGKKYFHQLHIKADVVWLQLMQLLITSTENLMLSLTTGPHVSVFVLLRFGCESAEAGRRGRAGIMRKSRSVLTVSPNNVSPSHQSSGSRPFLVPLDWNLLLMVMDVPKCSSVQVFEKYLHAVRGRFFLLKQSALKSIKLR